MAHIDFEAKTDRELLILVAQQSNETVDHLTKLNDKILKHERRITALETRSGCDASESAKKKGLKLALRDNWQTLSLAISIVALIILEVNRYVSL